MDHLTTAADIVLERRDGGVAIVRLNRPQMKNAMSLAMWRRLGALFTELGADKAVRSIVLTGAGSAFCSGADISEFARLRSTPEGGAAYEIAVDGAEHAIIRSPKPTIAAIEGPCVGGGLGLALSCDFRFADTSAYFAIPAARLGIIYGVTETRLLLSAVGITKAKEILFAGRRIEAAEAAAMGLVTHSVVKQALVAGTGADGAVLTAAIGFARSFATAAPRTIAGTKLVLGALADGELDARAGEIKAALHAAIVSADYKEGVAAFAAKRAPKFTGE
jgi:enoyl-CoA hydratase/carnithine racemase